MEPHLLNVSQITKILNCSLGQGLSASEVVRRQKIYGFNSVSLAQLASRYSYFIEILNTRLIRFLSIGVSLTCFYDLFTALSSLCVVYFGIFYAALINRSNQKKRNELFYEYPQSCEVLRDGMKQTISVAELVPGDLVYLSRGQYVPADARIIESQGLFINESIITRNPAAIEKNADIVEDEARIYERSNMVFKGSLILSGSALVVVCATGSKTIISMINQAIRKSPELPFVEELNKFSSFCKKTIFFLFIAMSCVIFFFKLSMQEWIIPLGCGCYIFFTYIMQALWQKKILKLIESYRAKNVLIQNQKALEQIEIISVVILDEIDLLDETTASINQLKTQGIKTIIITEKPQNVVIALAQEVGCYHSGDMIFDAQELGLLSDEELMRFINVATLYSSINAEYKLKLILLLQKLGKKVAITGQCMEDLLFFEHADLSIARKKAVDHVKKTADVIVLDNCLHEIFNEKLSLKNKLKWFKRIIGSLLIILVLGCFVDYFAKLAIVI